MATSERLARQIASKGLKAFVQFPQKQGRRFSQKTSQQLYRRSRLQKIKLAECVSITKLATLSVS
ncbi:hypothetical protein I8752_14450 [Nostocaceae cyanobacterium CENA369]|uniref:Uncharacterized protein n=1 Tax=Dendronalium phyllosphericum CENA369 TaxID=1725256 RepID=A0A8J7I3X2_9NOST|nr:hypothetical protein [Dendronalium phyllosphericum]MBH8574195.1 hypothetical protein [Dendronalium phyllosphericum CENA369]